MSFRTLPPVLRCADCGSQLMELRGPVTNHAVVRCAHCGAGARQWIQFLSDLGARVERQEYEIRRRRLH